MEVRSSVTPVQSLITPMVIGHHRLFQMAPGVVRNLKAKIIPNNSRQILMEHMTGGLTRSKTRQSEKTDMASDKVNKGLPITNGSSIGSKTVNMMFEGNMPTNQPPQTHQKKSNLMPEVQTPQTKHKESTFMPEVQTPQTQYKENTLMQEVQTPQTQQQERTLKNQSQQNGSTPHSPSQEGSQHSQSPQADIIASNTTIKKRRGQTMGKGIMKAFQACGKIMKVTVDPSIGRPKSRDESSKFSSQIGVVTRDVLPVPVRWKDVDEEKDLQPGIDHIKIHMDINLDDPGVKRCVIDRVQASSRQKRYRLHKHYKKYSSHEEAKNNKPSFCASQENWEEMCELFASPKFKHQSLINVTNRQMLRAPHVSGRTPFSVLRHEISEKEMNGGPLDMIELYKRTHYKEKGGWSTKEAEENWDLMISRREKYSEHGVEKSAQDILLEVLGHGAGYIKGYGYGPRPPSRRKAYDSNGQKELLETQEKLREKESEVIELKDQVSDLNAKVDKLMAFMAANGNII